MTYTFYDHLIKTTVFTLILTLPLFSNTFPFQTIEKAKEAYVNGEFDKSSELFKRLKKDDPSVAYNLANAQYKAGLYTEALKSYEKAQGTDEATRQYNIGNCYFQKGDLKEAIRRYRISFKLREDDDTWYNLNLAEIKRDEKEHQKEQDKKDKEKKKKEDEKRKKEEEKKRKEEEKKRKEEEKKRKEQEEKEKKKNQEKNEQKRKSNKREVNSAEKSKKNMSPKEKMRKKELSHLLKQLSKKKMPTMMYQINDKKGGENDKNPW